MITISHTHAEGTVAEGTSKGDGAGDVLKANGFWFRYGAWRIRGSRDRMSSWRIEAAAKALRATGFEVTVQVDDTPRPTAEVEAERAERADSRAGRFAGYAQNAAKRSAAAEAGAREIQKHIPFGQPVLVGHHSEAGHRRVLARIDRGWDKAVEEGRKANHWAGRANSAEISQQYRENVYVTLRRIDKLEAEHRRLLRDLDRFSEDSPAHPRITAKLAQLDDQIAHWKAHVAAAEVAGKKVWRPTDFAKGDYIQCGGSRWHRVLRVNAKSVSLRNPDSPNLAPVPIPYDKVTGHRTAAEHAAANLPEGGRA
ncbi:hypothetical protein CcI49_23155 [Frankia sp. CcI49]|uniref:DUF3560 domain-containing protein n=1 Tax=Frankia sp. CcI49 TaxID=1745382 RepID=UPI0009775CEF|nr:DUF3560 domain-containing protein [Frankia sp. CcI49]ONH58356.1 hypothetical protein CcI49_23155 [Frankia sp. CcI49]